MNFTSGYYRLENRNKKEKTGTLFWDKRGVLKRLLLIKNIKIEENGER